MKRQTAPFVLLIAAACLLFGCAKKPTMHVNHAEVSGVSVGFPPQLGIMMTVVVDVYNPNGYDVAIRAVRGTVTFADRYTLPVDFRAPTAEGVWLTSDATTQVRVPVTVPVDLAMTLVREAYATPSVPFRMIGKADVTATRSFKIESDDYSVDERGVLSRQQIEASMQGMMFPFPR